MKARPRSPRFPQARCLWARILILATRRISWSKRLRNRAACACQAFWFYGVVGVRFDAGIRIDYMDLFPLGVSHSRAGGVAPPCRTRCTVCVGAPCQHGCAKLLISL